MLRKTLNSNCRERLIRSQRAFSWNWVYSLLFGHQCSNLQDSVFLASALALRRETQSAFLFETLFVPLVQTLISVQRFERFTGVPPVSPGYSCSDLSRLLAGLSPPTAWCRRRHKSVWDFGKVPPIGRWSHRPACTGEKNKNKTTKQKRTKKFKIPKIPTVDQFKVPEIIILIPALRHIAFFII